MKKNNILSVKVLKPKKQTIDFLLKFSQSLAVVETAGKNFLVSKNWKFILITFVPYEKHKAYFFWSW